MWRDQKAVRLCRRDGRIHSKRRIARDKFRMFPVMSEILEQAEARGHEGIRHGGQAEAQGEGGPEAGGIAFPPGFPEEQKQALAALLAGASMAGAAQAAGVHRATVKRWLNDGGEFRNTLRVEQGKKLGRARTQARAIAAEAADVVARAIRGGDVRAAIVVLKALGVFENPEKQNPSGTEERTCVADDNQCRNGLPESGTVTG